MDFCGNNIHRMDEKGRVSIPSKYRKILEEKYNSFKLFVTFLDDGLTFYPLAEWEKIKNERLSAIDITTPEGRRKIRQFAGNAEELEVDSQGRVLIPAPLLAKAQLAKGEVVIVGNLTCFEIWNPVVWEKYNA